MYTWHSKQFPAEKWKINMRNSLIWYETKSKKQINRPSDIFADCPDKICVILLMGNLRNAHNKTSLRLCSEFDIVRLLIERIPQAINWKKTIDSLLQDSRLTNFFRLREKNNKKIQLSLSESCESSAMLITRFVCTQIIWNDRADNAFRSLIIIH